MVPGCTVADNTAKKELHAARLCCCYIPVHVMMCIVVIVMCAVVVTYEGRRYEGAC